MKHLMFKGKYLDKILQGMKRITIRRRTNLREGERFLIHSKGKIFAEATVTKVYSKDIHEIGEEEAEKEGEDLETLREELERLYGKGSVYVVEFDVIRIFDPPLDPAELRYGGSNPFALAREGLERGLYCSDEERRILEYILKYGSIRKAAKKLGGWKYRWKIRKVLEKIRKKIGAS